MGAMPFSPYAVPPYPVFPERIPRKVPIRSSFQMPTTTSASFVCVRLTCLQPGPITVKSVFDAVDAVPEQIRMGFLDGRRTVGVSPQHFPDGFSLRNVLPHWSCSGATKPKKPGTLAFWAASKIAFVSASEAAIGLSINTRFPALNTFSACSRCKRPSLVSSNTTSTFRSSSSMEPTISTPSFFTSSRIPRHPADTRFDVIAALRISRHDAVAIQFRTGGRTVQFFGESGAVRGVQTNDTNPFSLRQRSRFRHRKKGVRQAERESRSGCHTQKFSTVKQMIHPIRAKKVVLL